MNCLQIQIHGNSESSSDSEGDDENEGHRRYVYDWDWQIVFNTVVEIHFTSNSGVNDNILQKLCHNSVLTEMYIFNKLLNDDIFEMTVLETNWYVDPSQVNYC